jgi:DNA-binding transcriptional LysR family regulator
MDTEQMDQILTIKRTMNYKRASEELGVSQPTLSYQVKKAEEEIGFRIFRRDGKTISLTPAGEQFCISLREIREDYKRAVERAQNIDGKYSSSIRIGLPFRSAIPLLPQAIRRFYESTSDVSVVPEFHVYGDLSSFLSGSTDMEFMLREEAESMKGVDVVPLYRSGISLIVAEDDPLASRERVGEGDLQWRTLMVGGGSPPALRRVQQRIISSGRVDYFNSPDHDTTLTNVAVGSGVCLAPDFLHEKGDGFRWIPFDCPEGFDCVLALRGDAQPHAREFAVMLSDMHSHEG